VAQEPYWFLFERGAIAAMHGSPWKYDTYVPILFAGRGIPQSTVYRRVSTIDVAPTLAALVGTKPPARSRGAVLPDVVPSRLTP
jgi:arylsulfatase A-like enzyme